MRKFKLISVLLISLGLWILMQASVAQPVSKKTAAVLDIKGAIGPAVQDFIHRGLIQAQKSNAAVVILKIDTPGGLSKSMRGIIKDILASPVPIMSYVAPSGARAASAGTYILYASQIAAMAPGTNLGAATPVSIASPGASKDKQKDKKAKQKTASQLKAINDAKAYIRGLAQLHGRNVKWAERAVSHAESLSAKEALKLNVINVIAKNIPDLLKQVHGRQVLLRGQQVRLQTQDLPVKMIHPDWRTRFLAVITDPSVAYILLMVGFYGLFFEFANPGFVVPGVAGAVCLIISLYAFQLLPVNYAGLALIVLGMAFMVAEAFLPSFGALGVGGVIALAIGSVMLMKAEAVAFGIPWELIVGVVLVTALFLVLILQLAFRSRCQPVVSGAENMVGKVGVLKISDGELWVHVMGELWQVENHEGLKDGQSVKIIAVKGLLLQVKEC